MAKLKPAAVRLVWMGPAGHHSKRYGPLTPGQTTITVSAKDAPVYERNGWQRQTKETD